MILVNDSDCHLIGDSLNDYMILEAPDNGFMANDTN